MIDLYLKVEMRYEWNQLSMLLLQHAQLKEGFEHLYQVLHKKEKGNLEKGFQK